MGAKLEKLEARLLYISMMANTLPYDTSRCPLLEADIPKSRLSVSFGNNAA